MSKTKSFTKMSRGLAGLAAAGLLLITWPGPAPAAPAGIVVKQNVIDLFGGPGTGYAITGTARQGDTLDVVQRDGDWDEVRTSAGLTGWTSAALVILDQTQSAPSSATTPPATVTPTTTGVNIRSGPDTGHPVIGSASPGEQLTVEGESGRWYEVRIPNGTTGWIAGWYTRPVTPDDNTSTPANTGTTPVSQPSATAVSGSTSFTVQQTNLDLFGGPGTGYAVVGTSGRGETLSVIGQEGSWTEVRAVDGTTGWISSALVRIDQSQASPASSTLPATVTPTAPSLNIRSGPGTGHPVIGSASPGEQLVVEGESGQWYKIRTPDGILGWVADWYTHPVTAASQPPATTGDNPSGDSSSPITVTQPQITLFAGPGTGSGIAGNAAKGTVLVVLQTFGSWAKVQLPSGTTGWVPAVLVGANTGSGAEVSRGEKPASTGAVYAGKGAWFDIYSQMPDAADLATMAADGVTHIYLEVATTQSGFPAKWQNWLVSVLPAAHRAGIKVIAWVYVALHNPLADAQLTDQVANFRTPLGDRPDAVAADIESLPRHNPVAASQLVVAYASLARRQLPAGMPFIAITYPPQYRPSYPFAGMGSDFNAIALMDYWHITRNTYGYADAKSFVASSLKVTKSLAGSKVPLEVIVQGYNNNGTGMPSAQEISGALAGAEGAQGYSIYTWNSAAGTPAGNTFDSYRPKPETQSGSSNQK